MTLTQQIDKLFEEQVQSWPRLARGVDGLKHAQTRPVRMDWFDVFIRHIPHRVVSTTAAVDRESIAKRPCFLCAGNLDPEERGIPFNPDYTIYCNPLPIVDRHLTIVHRDHGIQHIAGEAGAMLDLAAALPGYFVIYNGPECGASAPDHMHFQAGSRDLFPIERDTAEVQGISVPNYARSVLLFRDAFRSHLIDRIDSAVELLSNVTRKRPEPLINIAVFYEGGRWTAYVFPREKHRPQVFHTGELTVSPASIDLCGIFVVPLGKDFARIAGADIASIFREVSLSDEILKEVAARL
jgi:hypothetical protein